MLRWVKICIEWQLVLSTCLFIYLYVWLLMYLWWYCLFMCDSLCLFDCIVCLYLTHYVSLMVLSVYEWLIMSLWWYCLFMSDSLCLFDDIDCPAVSLSTKKTCVLAEHSLLHFLHSLILNTFSFILNILSSAWYLWFVVKLVSEFSSNLAVIYVVILFCQWEDETARESPGYLP